MQIFIKVALMTLLTISLTATEIQVVSKQKQSNSAINVIIKVKDVDINSTKLFIKNKEVNTTVITYPNQDIKTATVFLIDTSMPMKNAVKKGIKPTIKKLYNLKSQFDEYCITQFDANLNIIKDFATELNTTLDTIKIKGQRTELFRASLEAMKLLNQKENYIKYLVILSDGEAEDTAYTIEDVLKEAKKQNITIISIGYRDSINMQSIRRMAEETKGKLFVANKTTHQLPQNFQNDFMSYYNDLAVIKIDKELLKPNLEAKVDFTIKITNDTNQTITKDISISVKKLFLKVKEESNLILYIGGGLILVIGLFLAFKPKKKENEIQDIEQDPKAYFETSAGAKLNIYKEHSTIGAVKENDIVIEGELISRHHAVLDIKDGKFYIVDRNSTNGVFVNYNKVLQQELNDGDIISFGPYEVIFKI